MSDITSSPPFFQIVAHLQCFPQWTVQAEDGIVSGRGRQPHFAQEGEKDCTEMMWWSNNHKYLMCLSLTSSDSSCLLVKWKMKDWLMCPDTLCPPICANYRISEIPIISPRDTPATIGDMRNIVSTHRTSFRKEVCVLMRVQDHRHFVAPMKLRTRQDMFVRAPLPTCNIPIREPIMTSFPTNGDVNRSDITSTNDTIPARSV
jgi:hypothetical protein